MNFFLKRAGPPDRPDPERPLRVLGVLAATLLASLSVGAGAAQPQACPVAPAHIVMESGSYSSQPGVTFVLHHFDAVLVPLGRTAPGCLSHRTDVAHADIFVSNETLTRVFAGKLDATGSDIRNLKIVHGAGTVTISGETGKVVPIKFSVAGPVSTDGTMLSLTADKIDADGIPIKMLLGLVGKHLSSVLGLKGVDGVLVEGNVMSFSPEKIAHLRGYIVSAQATPEGLTLHYGPRPRGSGRENVRPVRLR